MTSAYPLEFISGAELLRRQREAKSKAELLEEEAGPFYGAQTHPSKKVLYSHLRDISGLI